MSFQDIRDTREGFVRADIGDRLISIESKIIGVVAFFALWLGANQSFLVALVVAAVCIVVVPWLVGLISIFAWIVTIAFSLAWAIIGYFIGGAILGDSALAGAIVAIIVFVISFFLHKVFAGLGFNSVEKYALDTGEEIRDNTQNINQNLNNTMEAQTTFCTSCGTPMKVGAKFCNKCGKQQ